MTDLDDDDDDDMKDLDVLCQFVDRLYWKNF